MNTKTKLSERIRSLAKTVLSESFEKAKTAYSTRDTITIILIRLYLLKVGTSFLRPEEIAEELTEYNCQCDTSETYRLLTEILESQGIVERSPDGYRWGLSSSIKRVLAHQEDFRAAISPTTRFACEKYHYGSSLFSEKLYESFPIVLFDHSTSCMRGKQLYNSTEATLSPRVFQWQFSPDPEGYWTSGPM